MLNYFYHRVLKLLKSVIFEVKERIFGVISLPTATSRRDK